MSKVEQYEINTIQSGTVEGCYWVSLHFDSPHREFDRIHIVSPEENTGESDLEKAGALYIERDDQVYGGSGLAVAVNVSNSQIELRFTPKGQSRLEFPETLRLTWSPTINGWSEAMHQLKEMRQSQPAIKFVEPSHPANSAPLRL